MGVVQRQSIKTGIVDVIGIGIGMISLLFIYPLEDELYGLISFIYGYASLLVPFLSLGLGVLAIKYYPIASEGGISKKMFVNSLFALTVISSTVFLSVYWLFKESIFESLEILHFDTSNISDHESGILLLALLLMLVSIQRSYLSNFGKIAISSLVVDFGYKIVVPALVLLYHFGFITTQVVVISLGLFFALALVVLLGIGVKSQLNGSGISMKTFKFLGNKGAFSFMFFSSLSSLSSLLAFRIDIVMIAMLLSLESNGHYAKILLISNVIGLPSRIIDKTAAPQVSKMWASDDSEGLGEIYKKSALNMFIIGGMIFTLLWVILEDLIQLSVNPESFRSAKEILLFLGLGHIINLISGNNSSIIGYSESYRLNFIFILLLGLANIVLNYVFIGTYDIVGAAMATMWAFLIFNLAKGVFLYVKYRIHPFSWRVVRAFCVLLGILVIGQFLPVSGNPYIDIVWKGGIIALLVLIAILKLGISEDLEKFILSQWINLLKIRR